MTSEERIRTAARGLLDRIDALYPDDDSYVTEANALEAALTHPSGDDDLREARRLLERAMCFVTYHPLTDDCRQFLARTAYVEADSGQVPGA